MKRVVFDVILFLSVLIFPWWISVLGVIIGIFAFKNFYEYIIAGVVIYSIFSVPSSRIISSPVLISLIIVGSYLIIQYIKNNIILYKK
jgi:hypothetical protein